jgi:hypothetical protein
MYSRVSQQSRLVQLLVSFLTCALSMMVTTQVLLLSIAQEGEDGKKNRSTAGERGNRTDSRPVVWCSMIQVYNEQVRGGEGPTAELAQGSRAGKI